MRELMMYGDSADTKFATAGILVKGDREKCRGNGMSWSWILSQGTIQPSLWKVEAEAMKTEYQGGQHVQERVMDM